MLQVEHFYRTACDLSVCRLSRPEHNGYRTPSVMVNIMLLLLQHQPAYYGLHAAFVMSEVV